MGKEKSDSQKSTGKQSRAFPAAAANNTVAYLQAAHPEILARSLKPKERSKKVRIYLISLLPYPVQLTKKVISAEDNQPEYLFLNSFGQFEEFHLLTEMGINLAIFKVTKEPTTADDFLMEFTVSEDRVSRISPFFSRLFSVPFH
jgi:hypothetical protein